MIKFQVTFLVTIAIVDWRLCPCIMLYLFLKQCQPTPVAANSGSNEKPNEIKMGFCQMLFFCNDDLVN